MPAKSVHDRARAALLESRARMICESPEPLGAFFIGTAPVGRLKSIVRNRLTSERYFSLIRTTPIGQRLMADDTPEARSEALEMLLEFLCEDGLCALPTGEKIDIIYHNELIAKVDRIAVRLLGLQTRVVRLVALDATGCQVLQKRSASKRIAPGLLDDFAAGMVAAGETPATAMLRETREETGLVLNESTLGEPVFCFKSARPVPDGFIFEENIVYTTMLPVAFSPTNEDGEVDCFRTMSDEEILAAVEANVIMPEAAHVFLTAYENA